MCFSAQFTLWISSPPQWKSLRPEEKKMAVREPGHRDYHDPMALGAVKQSHTRNGHGKKCSIRSHRHVICMQQTRGEGLPPNFYTRLSGALCSTFLLCVNMAETLDCVTSDGMAQPALSLVKSQSLNYYCISILQFQDCHQLLNSTEAPFICTPKPVTCHFGVQKTPLVSVLHLCSANQRKMLLKCISLFITSFIMSFFFFRNISTPEEAFVKEPQFPPACPSFCEFLFYFSPHVNDTQNVLTIPWACQHETFFFLFFFFWLWSSVTS